MKGKPVKIETKLFIQLKTTFFSASELAPI
jgi:hypothetical protein